MPTDEELKKEITDRVERFAEERGVILSELKENILNDLVNMHQKFNDFYCPCQPENVASTICICSAVRHGLIESEGACFCYLFVAKEQSEE